MYQPDAFREDRADLLAALIRAEPLGLLVSAPGGLPVADPVPFLLDAEQGPRGTLRAHVARANPHWRGLAAAPDCLVVFQGPAAYVSPSLYATKRETGKVVPTWNYVVVQVRGRARVIEDAAWLRRQIDDLTRAREAGRAEPWAVADAPEPFVAAQIRGIVGIEIPIEAMTGKWKVSQNRPEADRIGVAEGLAGEAPAMAGLVAERRQR
ncbi:FMN-binding negative transcriptional regulator [Amaricoccus sp.]|uniref:FMN-binding negative transcriptional regulator n=1 Tax=Amaricoccus sp. TaxID=1872485 RepID=UPI002636A2C9|nr:FMN-binding negative transcriptional regulator [uncultured Amaricoccus sp.]